MLKGGGKKSMEGEKRKKKRPENAFPFLTLFGGKKLEKYVGGVKKILKKE